MDLIDAATSGNMTLLLAVIVVALSSIVGFLFSLLIKEKDARVKRAEGLTDTANATNDRLAATNDKQADAFRTALDELRKR